MIYAVVALVICFLLACLGTSVLFFIKKGNHKIDTFLYAFSAGVMFASAIFSLIIPSIEYCETLGYSSTVVLSLCFGLAGAMFLALEFFSKNRQEGTINTKMLTLGVLLHNIPEGLCVGFAFASYSVLGTHESLMSAIMIAVGIGIQNIPEGSTVAFPLYLNGASKKRSFLTSILVAFIEIPAGIVAFALGSSFISILPFMLAFASATMIIVASCDLMPETVKISEKWSIVWMLLGFICMMSLDLLFG